MSRITGIVNVLKPPGMTSFDVVSWLKTSLSAAKAGHTGTLDPLAAGVLPICLGRATKIIPFLPESRKKYRCEIRLGLKTETLDREGEIVHRDDSWQNLTEEDIAEVREDFIGEGEQIPPLFSAVKKDGRKLYELAREGEEVEADPRPITVFALDLLEVDLPLIHLDVECSKGTYIRSLARDLGESLGTSGTLNFLIRTASGPFTIDSALPPADISPEKKEEQIISLTDPLPYPQLEVKTAALEKAINGAELRLDEVRFEDERERERAVVSAGEAEEELYILRGPDNLFISICSLLRGKDDILLSHERVFNIEEQTVRSGG